MARLRFSVTTEGEQALTTSEETILQVVAPTNHRVAVLGFSVSFDASALAAAVEVQIARQTTAGTSAAATPVKDDDSIAETIQSTARKNFTAEPTKGDILRRYNIQPASGGIEMVFGDDEIIIGGGDRLGIICIAPAAVNVFAHFNCEE